MSLHRSAAPGSRVHKNEMERDACRRCNRYESKSVEGRPLDVQEPTERDLIERSQDGDIGAFEQLVRIHQSIALRVAYLVVRDHAEAEDVTQDAFVNAFRAIDTFRSGPAFRPWLLAIVRNEALNRVRKRHRVANLALKVATNPISADAAPSAESEVATNQLRQRVLAAVDELPDRYRVVVSHRYLLELSESETSAVLGIPTGTVKSRTSRGLNKLRTMLELAGINDD